VGCSIVITASHIAPEALAALEESGVELLLTGALGSADELAAIVAREQPEALIVRGGKVTPAVIEASPRLRVICKHGVGVDNIDVAAATSRGIPVMNTPGVNARSVAELALTLMLCVIKQIPRLDWGVRHGQWERTNYHGAELTEKRLGLVGLGAIGRNLIQLVQPFAVAICAYDPHVPASVFREVGVDRADDLDGLLAAADVVSLHCPLTPETRHIIGRREMELMKPTACLINTARGGLVDEDALIDALRTGKIAGAGLDAQAHEPPAAGHPLWELRNVVLTPHVGGSTEEGLRRMGIGAARTVLDFLAGRPTDPACLLNPTVLAGRSSQ
jgi:D-3-phosphoglycerate dehydrogenase